MKQIAVIGYGAIASYVFNALHRRDDMTLATVFARPGREDAARKAAGMQVQIAHRLCDLNRHPDLVLDCAGHAGLREFGKPVLSAGIDLVSVSVGALADEKLLTELRVAAEQGGSRLRMIPGAIGGLDVLAAARQGGLARVTYTGRKPPGAWVGTQAETAINLGNLTKPTVHFSGNAGNAARTYPKNANVAAAIALAGIGFEKTEVKLIADPTQTANRHEVMAEGAFGRFRIEIDGNSLPDNPKSSALTAMSMMRAVDDLQAVLTIG